MRYVQLRAFHHVASEGGFSRAAEVLRLTQPAVSDQVRRLEEDYDVVLFDRSRRRVVLTEAGTRLLSITRRMFEAERDALDHLSESRALRAGTLRIVADSALHLLRILPVFRSRHPGVAVSVQAGNSETVTERLRRYEADIGVMGERPAGRDFEMLRLNESPIVAVVPRGAALAGRASLGFADLVAAPLVLREEGSKTRAKVLAAARAAGIELRAAVEAEGREAVREIVAAGGGLGFMSEAEFGADPRLVAVPIRPAAGLMMEEVLVCLGQRRQGKLIAAFFEIAAAQPG